jgi:hypothetical protein
VVTQHVDESGAGVILLRTVRTVAGKLLDYCTYCVSTYCSDQENLLHNHKIFLQYSTFE